MYFCIDFSDWDRDQLPFDNTDALLEFYLEKARSGKSNEPIPELSKIPVFCGVFRRAMCLASAQNMKVEVVFVKNMLGMLRLSAETLTCREEYNDRTRKSFLEMLGKGRSSAYPPMGAGYVLKCIMTYIKKAHGLLAMSFSDCIQTQSWFRPRPGLLFQTPPPPTCFPLRGKWRACEPIGGGCYAPEQDRRTML